MTRQEQLVKVHELHDRLRKAEDEYLALRDAKSDGCCVGLSIYGVLAYDGKIEAAAKHMRESREDYLAFIQEHKDDIV